MEGVLLHKSTIGKLVYIKKSHNNLDCGFLLFTIERFESDSKYFNRFCSDMSKIYNDFASKGIKFAQIYDLRESVITDVYKNMMFVKKYGDYLDNHKEIITNYCYGTTLVIETPSVRKLINIGLKWYTHKKPTKVMMNFESSYEWLWELVDKESRQRK
jgi:hypothetical protein